MALSVLGTWNNAILYDSTTKTGILCGSKVEMEEWKHKMETAEQESSNKVYMEELRKERTHILTTAGHSEEEVDKFLREKMPYLYL